MRFTRVALVPAGEAREDGVARWVRSEALAAVVAAFGGAVPDDADLPTQLAWLETFSERWDRRAGLERDQAAPQSYDEATTELITSAATALGMIGSPPLEGAVFDHVLVLGGLVRACFSRPRLASDLLTAGTVRCGRVTALGAFRPLSDGERVLAAELGHPDLADEYEAMTAGTAAAFELGPVEDEAGVAADDVGGSWRVRRWAAGERSVSVVAAPSSAPSTRRADTADTYAWLATSGELTPGEQLLLVTTDIYVPYQHAVAVRMLSLPHDVQVTTIGVDGATRRGPLAQQFTAANYLQEMRSTIRALRALADADADA